MKTTVHRVGRLSLKLFACLIILLCLAAGLAGLVLPIIPGLLFLALAAFITARHFPGAERWARSHPGIGKYMNDARRFSWSRISLSRLTLAQRLRFAALLLAKALVDGAALAGGLLTRLLRRAAGGPGFRRRC